MSIDTSRDVAYVRVSVNYLTQESRIRIGLRIRRARKQSGLSHDRLGAIAGTSRQHLIKLEKGKHAPREDLLRRIADATGKTIAFFTEDEEGDDSETDPVAALVNAARAFVWAEMDRRLAVAEGLEVAGSTQHTSPQ